MHPSSQIHRKAIPFKFKALGIASCKAGCLYLLEVVQYIKEFSCSLLLLRWKSPVQCLVHVKPLPKVVGAHWAGVIPCQIRMQPHGQPQQQQTLEGDNILNNSSCLQCICAVTIPQQTNEWQIHNTSCLKHHHTGRFNLSLLDLSFPCCCPQYCSPKSNETQGSALQDGCANRKSLKREHCQFGHLPPCKRS